MSKSSFFLLYSFALLFWLFGLAGTASAAILANQALGTSGLAPDINYVLQNTNTPYATNTIYFGFKATQSNTGGNGWDVFDSGGNIKYCSENYGQVYINATGTWYAAGTYPAATSSYVYTCAYTSSTYTGLLMHGYSGQGAVGILNSLASSSLPGYCVSDNLTEAENCIATPAPSLSIAYPVDGTTTPDFTNWVINNNNAPPYGELSVNYGFSSSSFSHTDSINFDPFINANPTIIKKSQSLWYPPLAVPVTWYAQAVDTWATSSLSSPVIQFYVDPSDPLPPVSSDTILAIPVSLSSGNTSSTILNPTTNCNATSSSFWDSVVVDTQNAVCISLTYLFIPNNAQQAGLAAGYQNIISSYSQKPPFGYFSSIQADLSGLAVGSTSLVVIPTSSTGTPYEVFAPFQQLDTGLAGIMYLALGFTIFQITRGLNL